MTIKDIFYLALHDIKHRYDAYQFIVARDIIWILQQRLTVLFETFELPYDVYYGYPVEKATRLKPAQDLIIIEKGTHYKDILAKRTQAVAIFRIKYEPSAKRYDICDYQLPYLLPTMIQADIDELARLVDEQKTTLAISVLIDESSRHYARLTETETSSWYHWGAYGDENLNVSAFLTEVMKNEVA